jgi:hypothetical protein
MLTLVFEEEHGNDVWIEAFFLDRLESLLEVLFSPRIDILHVANKKNGNAPHLNGIFETLQKCDSTRNRSKNRFPDRVIGFVEETARGVVNPGYIAVQRSSAAIGDALEDLMESRGDGGDKGKGTSIEELEKRFADESDRVVARYPDPPNGPRRFATCPMQ